MDDGHDGEEHDDQRGERQGFLERMPDPVLVGDARERRCNHDQGEADEPDGGDVECQRGDEQQCGDGLHDEHRAIMRRAIVRFGASEIL